MYFTVYIVIHYKYLWKYLNDVSYVYSYPICWIRVWVFEIQIVFSLPAEFWGGHVHSDLDQPRVSCLLYGQLQQLQSWTMAK